MLTHFCLKQWEQGIFGMDEYIRRVCFLPRGHVGDCKVIDLFERLFLKQGLTRWHEYMKFGVRLPNDR